MTHETQHIQTVSIGLGDFKRVRTKNSFFVDKSLFIRDFMAHGAVNVILRPRRFGKTHNLSMLSYYLAHNDDMTEQKNLFAGLKIMEDESFRNEHFGKYSVLYLDLKNCVSGTKTAILVKIRRTLTIMIEPFWNIVGEALKQLYMSDAGNHSAFIHSIPDDKLETILCDLSSYLQKLTGRYSIILIDEYDAPLNVEFASEKDQKDTEKFFSELFSCALKSNTSVFNACLVGVAEIGGSGILSGLNNLVVSSLRNNLFSSYFGFTQAEVIQVLTTQMNLSEQDADNEWEREDGIRDWYNGYQIGDSMVINPWSFAYYLFTQRTLESYWTLTSSTEALFDICRENPLFGEAVAESFLILR
jgi:hypothetical protein